MPYHNLKQTLVLEGIFVGYIEGGYIFHLENDEMIDFDLVNPKVLKDFDLKSTFYKNKRFEVVYSEDFNNLSDEEFVVFKLEQLKLL